MPIHAILQFQELLKIEENRDMKQTEETSNSTLDLSTCKVSTPSNVIAYFVCARVCHSQETIVLFHIGWCTTSV